MSVFIPPALRAVLSDIVRFAFEDEGGRRRGAPTHCHQVPGKWDGDRQHPKGSECLECSAWNQLQEMLAGQPMGDVDPMDELRRSVAQIVGADENTWPTHGNVGLAIASLVAVLKAEADIPEGYTLVPITPTAAMREAFHEAHEQWEDGGFDSPDHQWGAMLEAFARSVVSASEPPLQGKEQGAGE